MCSLLVGPSDLVSARHIWEWAVNGIFQTGFAQNYDKELIEAVVLNTRLPRIILALLIGASLTASGTTLQALFRNPLVSPDILGLSSGAAFGAALAYVIPSLPVQPMAFFFGLMAAGLSYFLAVKKREVSTVSLILSGVIVSAVFTCTFGYHCSFLRTHLSSRPLYTGQWGISIMQAGRRSGHRLCLF